MDKLLTILLASLALLCLSCELLAANLPPAEAQQQTEKKADLRNIEIIKDIRAFIQQNPHLRLVRLNKNLPANHRTQPVKYTVGSRVSGDRLLAQYADAFFYDVPTNVSHQVTYPQTGTGAVITSLDIHCLQSGADGNAYIVAGGIEQRFISIVLEATETLRFSYNVHIYGTF